jgi:type VI secretion system secreted protein Hcp
MKRLFLLVPFLALAGPADAALNAYMKITRADGSILEGEVTQPGRERMILVHEVTHQVVQPVDTATGLPSGKRQHKPFVITKSVDKSTPLFFQALVQNETLRSVEIFFWRPDQQGREVNYFKVTLTNAIITSSAMKLPSTLDPTASQPLAEEISFVYQKITWTYTDGNITAEDDLTRGGA